MVILTKAKYLKYVFNKLCSDFCTLNGKYGYLNMINDIIIKLYFLFS